MEKTYALVRSNTHAAAQNRKRQYHATVKFADFTSGKLVWVYYPRSWKRRSPKWTSSYIGPCMVERRINAVTYAVKRSPNGQSFVVHVDKLKPFCGVMPSNWTAYLSRKEARLQDAVLDTENAPGQIHATDALAGSVADGQPGWIHATDVSAGPVTEDAPSRRRAFNKLAGLKAEDVTASPAEDARGKKNMLPQPSGHGVGSPPECQGNRDVKNSATARPRRNRQKPRWLSQYINTITVATGKNGYSGLKGDMESSDNLVCRQRGSDGRICGRQFSTDSGIRRHLVVVHGMRYHAGRSPTPMNEADRRCRENVIRGRQQNSKTRQRNARRRTAKVQRISAAACGARADDGAGMPVTVDYSDSPGTSAVVAAITVSAPTLMCDNGANDWELAVADYSSSGDMSLLNEFDFTKMLDDFDALFPAPNGTSAAADSSGVMERDAVVAVAPPQTASVGVATSSTSTRSVGVETRRETEDTVRGYQAPLELPNGASVRDLFRLLRRHPSVQPAVLARCLARSSFFGRPLGGLEH